MFGGPSDGPLPDVEGGVGRLTVSEFQTVSDVSRETLERLEVFAELLKKWTSRINLVSRRSLDDLWRRHMLDSIQLLPWDKETNISGPWLDLGSGAGFPGLILAIAGVRDVHLVESDGRKCTFLREAARLTETEVTVHNSRIEALAPLAARTISARALAPLAKLLPLATPHLALGGQILLLKGQDIDAELTEAAKCWKIHRRHIPSVTDDSGSILQLTEIARV